MATLEELVVRIKADASQLEREMKRASGVVQQSTDKMKGSVSGLTNAFRGLLPAITGAALVGFAKQAVDTAGRMNDLAGRIGFANSTLAALEGGLADSGASLDEFAASINLMNANIGQAVSGNVQLQEAFQRLGLSVHELKTLSPEQQFYAIGTALSSLKTQYEQTELGRAIFGRGFAALIPLLKEANGDLEKTVGAIKATGDALSGETLARVDAFGDAMGRAGREIRDQFLGALDAVLRLTSAVSSLGPTASQSSDARLSNYGIPSASADAKATAAQARSRIDAYQAKQRAMGFPAAAAFLGNQQYGPNAVKNYGTAFGPAQKQAGGAKGLSDAEKELNRIRQEGELITERNRTAYEKYSLAVQEAQKALKAGAIDQTTYQRELIRLQHELSDETTRGMETATEATDELAVSIRSSLSNAFEDAIFDAKNFSAGMTSILDGIARQIARKGFIDPLSNSLTGLIGNAFSGGNSLPWQKSGGILSGIGSMLGFADGGSPPVGVPSIVGERGPEIFVPKTAGMVVPNHALGGSNVTVQNTWNIGDGVTQRQLAGLIPQIEARTMAAVAASIEQGGRMSRLVNRKS